MNSKQDLSDVAKNIIDSVLYMVLGTADETGSPWGSPVYFASEKYKEFYWMSSPDARHSRNIVVRPQVSIVIFDSQVPVGMGQAVYISATAKELADDDLDRGLQIYNGRFQNPAERGVRLISLEGIRNPAPYRLYRAIAQEHWILDPASADHAIEHQRESFVR